MRRRDRALTRSSHQSKIIQESVSIAWMSRFGSGSARTFFARLSMLRADDIVSASADPTKIPGSRCCCSCENVWRYPFVHLRPALYVMRQRHRQRFLSFHKRSGRISHGVRQRDRQRLFYGYKRAGISSRVGSGRHFLSRCPSVYAIQRENRNVARPIPLGTAVAV